MKVLLIHPPMDHIIRNSLPTVVEDSTGVYPPLGLLYVAAYAECVPGCEVTLWDCQAERTGYDELGRRLGDLAPDVVGVQVTTFTLIDAVLTARLVRKMAPGAFIVFGGPHPTLYPRETAQLPEVDAVIVGEGEHPFEALLRALVAGEPPDAVPAVRTRGESGQRPVELRYIEDMDGLKMPARHLVDLRRYTSPLAADGRVTTMMSSRGCPGRCVFCDRPQMGKRFRKRSAESVVAEMSHCVRDLGIGSIVFYDDTFTIDRDRVIEICDRILDSRLEVSWDIRARIDTVTPEMIRKLRAAGCGRIHYGVETGSPRLQKLIRKNLDLGQVRDVFAFTRREGIETLGYFMIGLPTERREEVEVTLDFMLSLPMDYAHVTLFTPYPGTEIYHQALAEGIYERDYWREFSQDPHPDFAPRFWNEHFSDEELLALMRQAYERFYCRSGYVFRRLIRVRSAGELLRKASVGLKLIREVAFNR